MWQAANDTCPCANPNSSDSWLPTHPILEIFFDWLEEQLGLRVTLDPLLVAYGIVLVLLVVFFVREDATFHSSRWAERRYLKATIALTFLTTFMAFLGQKQDRIAGMHKCVEAVIMTIAIMHIWQHNQDTLLLPRFHAQQVQHCSSTEPCRKEPTPMALRAEQELESLTMQVINNNNIWTVSNMGAFSIIVFWVIIAAIAALEGRLLYYIRIAAKLVVLGLLLYGGVSDMLARWRAVQSRVDIHHRIHGIVSRRDRATLEHVLENLSVGSLIEVAAPDTQKLLFDKSLRAGLLDVRAKAILIDALMKSGLAQNDKNMDALRLIMLSTTGMELTKLKDLIDGGGDYYSLFKLLHTDVTSIPLRERLLKHIALESRRVREQLDGRVGIKLLSDVDDTLYSSGGKFPAGCDTDYPKHMVYPGCLHLFKALDGAFKAGLSSCNMVFLSARPHIYKDMAEDHTYMLFRRLVKEGNMHSLPTLLPGEKTEGLEAMLTHSCRKSLAWRRVGEAKFTTYMKFKQLYLEYDFIFFGDNGQGDLLAGQLMMKEEEESTMANSSRLLAVLIHEVCPMEESLALNPCSPRNMIWSNMLETQCIFHHKTYVGAALALHQMDPKLLPASQLEEIARQAVREFDIDRLMYPELSRQWSNPERNLRADLQKVGPVLAEARLEPLPPLAPTTDEHRVMDEYSSITTDSDESDSYSC